MTEVAIHVAIAAEMQESETPVGLLFMDQKAVAGSETLAGEKPVQDSSLTITCCLTPCMHAREHGKFW